MEKKLPTRYDVATHLFSLSTHPKHDNMKRAINDHSKFLIDIWTIAFGCGHTLSLNAVKNRMLKLVKDYFNNVYTRLHRKTIKHSDSNDCTCKECLTNETKRLITHKWKVDNDVLFDIGVDMNSLVGDEKMFYEDQNSRRIGKISNEIDVEYVCEQEEQNRKRQKIEEELAAEELYINEVDDEVINGYNNNTNDDINDENSVNMSFSLNRSGLVRSCPGVDASTQTDGGVDRPKLRINIRVCTDEIKNTCALLSSQCGVSNEMARKIVKLVGKELYGHDFYLSANEQFAAEEKSEAIDVDDQPNKPKDRTYVISSARTNSDHKLILASEQETEGACTLISHDSKTSPTK